MELAEESQIGTGLVNPPWIEGGCAVVRHAEGVGADCFAGTQGIVNVVAQWHEADVGVVEVTGDLVRCRFVQDQQWFGRVPGDGGDDTAILGELADPCGRYMGDRTGRENTVEGSTIGTPP